MFIFGSELNSYQLAMGSLFEYSNTLRTCTCTMTKPLKPFNLFQKCLETGETTKSLEYEKCQETGETTKSLSIMTFSRDFVVLVIDPFEYGKCLRTLFPKYT